MNRNFRTYSFSLFVVLVVCAGCSTTKSTSWNFAKSLDLRSAIGLKSDQPTPPEIPLKMASSWTDTVLNKAGQKPKRGFGGRLTFFGQDRETPIRIDGQLVVYAFEETKGQPRSTQPTRRYIFPAEQFVRHESESTLGPSYSVWLPWDEVGGLQKNISLIARFEPNGGSLIVGEQTRHLLPGRALVTKTDTPSANSGIRLAQHVSEDRRKKVSSAVATEALPQPPLKMTTASIPLPSNWRQRLATDLQEKPGMQEEASTRVLEPAGAPRFAPGLQ